MGGTQLLDLPAEMLQSVCSFVDASDLPTLRLTCKTLEAAAFDLFATEYLSNLTCYFMQSVRLTRLENILRTPHLVRKVKDVKLCLYIWERNDTINAKRPQSDKYQPHDVGDGEMQRLNRREPDAGHISRIFSLLKSAGARLDLDLLRPLSHKQLLLWQHIDPKILQLIRAAAIPLHALALENVSMQHPTTTDEELAVAAQLRTLKQFQYSCDYQQGFGDARSHELTMLSYVLTAASNLQHLDIYIDSANCIDISTELRNLSCLPNLHELNFSGCFHISYTVLASWLQACTSLRTLKAESTILEFGPNRESWYEILHLLRLLPELHVVDLGELGMSGWGMNIPSAQVGLHHDWYDLIINTSSRKETMAELDSHIARIERSRSSLSGLQPHG